MMKLHRIPLLALHSLNFMVVILCLGGTAAAQVQTPQIEGTYSYDIHFALEQATLTVERVRNSSSTRTSGSLRLELWATNSQYSGGSISGYQVAVYRFPGTGQLSPNTSFVNISQTMGINSRPPAGAYFTTLILSEYSDSCTSNDKFCIIHYGTFSSPLTVPAPAVIADDEEEGGGAFSGRFAAALAMLTAVYALRRRRGRVLPAR
jgi:hypothetical protein